MRFQHFLATYTFTSKTIENMTPNQFFFSCAHNDINTSTTPSPRPPQWRARCEKHHENIFIAKATCCCPSSLASEIHISSEISIFFANIHVYCVKNSGKHDTKSVFFSRAHKYKNTSTPPTPRPPPWRARCEKLQER